MSDSLQEVKNWLKPIFEAWQKAFTAMKERLEAVEKAMVGQEKIEAAAREAAREAVHQRFASEEGRKSLLPLLVPLILSDPNSLLAFTNAITGNLKATQAVARAVAEANRAFYERRDLIREILGEAADGNDREIIRAANVHLEEFGPLPGLSLEELHDHLAGFVTREQAAGNLPKTTGQPVSAGNDDLTPNFSDPEDVVKLIEKLVKPDEFAKHQPELLKLARTFSRRKPENQTKELLVSTVLGKCGDIFIAAD